MSKRITAFFSLLFLFSPSVALAQVCSPSRGGTGILTGLAEQFHTTTAPWTTTALGYARGMFFALVAIEIAWSGITYVLQKDSIPEFLSALVLKLLSVGFFLILLQPAYGPVWIADIVSSFMQAGSAVSGQATFQTSDPSAIFGCGTDIAGAMMQSVSGRVPTFNLIEIAQAFLTALLCSLGVVLAFAIAAGQLLITLIESYIVIGGGIFMLGFTGSRWTLVFGEKYIGYIFSVGVKLFMLELIVGVGFGLGRQWATIFGSTTTPPPGAYLEVVGAAFIFALIAWQIPSFAAALMNGSPRMTLGGALGTAGTAAVGGMVTVAGVASLAAGASAAVGKGVAAVRAAADAGQSPQASVAGGSGMKTESKTRDDAGFPARGATRARLPQQNGAVQERQGIDPTPATPTAGSVSQREEHDTEEGARDTEVPDNAEAAAPDNGMRTSGERKDAGSSDAAPGKASAHRTGPGFRMPPVPDDSADGGIHIRFKHPE